MSVKNSELEVFNPFDGSQVGSVKINNANEIEEMLESGFRLHKENPKDLVHTVEFKFFIKPRQ